MEDIFNPNATNAEKVTDDEFNSEDEEVDKLRIEKDNQTTETTGED